MGIQCYWPWDRKRRTTVESQRQQFHGVNNTSSGNRRKRRRSNGRIDEYVRLFGYGQRRKFHHIKSWRGISIYPKLFWAWDDQSDNNTKSDRHKKRHRRNKYVYAVGASLLSLVNPTVTLAENVGGISATANPIANSSGSVTNQAIQVLQGPYVTNTYGNQISCQGATFNATPYIQYSNSWKDPFERTYLEPQYNNTDFTGRITTQTITVKNYPWYDGWKRGPNNADGTMGPYLLDDDGNKIPIDENWYDNRVKQNADGSIMLDDDGNPIRYYADGADMPYEIEVDGPDGIPDNPGEKIWDKPMRTDMTANNNFNIGLSATFSLPLDKKLQRLCKEAATTQIEQQKQLTANKRLDFEIARLKNCGELMKAGIMFHPKSPYHSVCADVVVVTPPGKILPHSHDLPQLNFPSGDEQPSQQHSPPSASTSSLEETESSLSSPSTSEPSQELSSQQVLSPSGANLLGVWQVGRMSLPQQQSQP